MKIKNNAAYEVAEIAGRGRYWLRREFCDLSNGRTRRVLISIEKAENEWNFLIEDKQNRLSWKLMRMTINGEEKSVFERFIRSNEKIKEEIFELSYLPLWIVEEIKQVKEEFEEKKMNEEILNFLTKLVTNIEQEKNDSKSRLSAKIEALGIGGLYHILSTTRGDSRGSFREVARFPEVELLTGYDFIGKQVNHSVSSYGTLRGIHVEPWAKLVTVISGLAVSILLDCRPGSKTYGKTEIVYLGYGTAPDGTEVNGGALFIEPGIGNSVLVLSEKLDYQYVVDDLWRPETALYAVNPMDPELKLPWTKWVPEDKIVRSERDTTSPTFKEFTAKMTKK